MLVDWQPRDIKRAKNAGGWTAEEEEALLEAVKEHGLDFERIKATKGARLGHRSISAIDNRFRSRYPEWKKMSTLTSKEDAVLLDAVYKYGLDFYRIKAEYGACLGHRKANTLKNIFYKINPEKRRELKEKRKLAKRNKDSAKTSDQK